VEKIDKTKYATLAWMFDESSDNMSLYRDGPGKLRGSRRIFITGIILCCKTTQLFFERGAQMLQIMVGNVSNPGFIGVLPV